MVCQVVISDATKQAKLDVLANHIEVIILLISGLSSLDFDLFSWGKVLRKNPKKCLRSLALSSNNSKNSKPILARKSNHIWSDLSSIIVDIGTSDGSKN